MNEIETPATYTRSLSDLLRESAVRHKHLCPRQVLGARLGLLGAQSLKIDLPNTHKRLLIIIETDGCFADGVSVATGCTIGARTLRVVDHGKIAATFIDTQIGHAVRIIPRHESRALAQQYAPQAKSRWHAQLEAYQIMPDNDLFSAERVELTLSLEKLLSKPGYKARCDACGEEIINEREIIQGNRTLCRACAGDSYWRPVTDGRGEAKALYLEKAQSYQVALEREVTAEYQTGLRVYDRVPPWQLRLVEGENSERLSKLQQSSPVVETVSVVE